MAFQKNQILTLSIESLSNDGSGVAHHDGQAVFVAAAAPGDVAEVRIVKPMKGYAFGKLEKLLTPGPGPRQTGLSRSRPLRRLRPAAYQLCGRVRRQNAVCAGCF